MKQSGWYWPYDFSFPWSHNDVTKHQTIDGAYSKNIDYASIPTIIWWEQLSLTDFVNQSVTHPYTTCLWKYLND